VCDFRLHSGKLLIIDPSYVPSFDEGLLVELHPGLYTVQLSDDYERMRLSSSRQRVRRGRKLGMMCTDSATAGICDFELFRRAWHSDDEGNRRIESDLQSADVGVAVLDETIDAVMPFVPSGEGDGEYPVYELRTGEKVVGIEIDFTSEFDHNALVAQEIRQYWAGVDLAAEGIWEHSNGTSFVAQQPSGGSCHEVSIGYSADSYISTAAPEHNATNHGQVVIGLSNNQLDHPTEQAQSSQPATPETDENG
jgi:hypothetical protein